MKTTLQKTMLMATLIFTLSEFLNAQIEVSTSVTGISYLTNVNGTLFFYGNNSSNGSELWKSDGTSAGTVMVKDITPGVGGSFINDFIKFNNKLFFEGSKLSEGELWVSDGTDAGTMLVKDINPGTTSSSPSEFTVSNNILFFVANDGTNGKELWKSDGTAAGTVMVKDIVSGSGGSSPKKLTDVNGALFFKANSTELWKSDGTDAGTVLVKSGITIDGTTINIGGILFFEGTGGGGTELWKSDGTDAGTIRVKDINAGSGSSGPYYDFCNINGILYFTASNGNGTNENGGELWKSDGTEAGTTLVKDIYTGAANGNPSSLTNVNGTLFFFATDGVNGYELWKSDGTDAGTIMVKDINPGPASSNPSVQYRIDYNGSLFFEAIDITSGLELWKSDGTSAGTVQVMDINSGSGGSSPNSLVIANNTLFFAAAANGSTFRLWKYDGTTGIVSPDVSNLITLSPNPSTGKFTLQIMNDELRMLNNEVKIYNILGEAIQHSIFSIQHSTFIDISNHPSGIYFVQIKDGDTEGLGTGKVYNQKIIKQ